MTKYILIILFLSVLFACGDRTGNRNYIQDLKLEGTLEIPINDSTINTGAISYVTLEEGSFVYTFQELGSNYFIFLYDLNDTTNNLEIRIPKEGENGVGVLFDYALVHNLDSIFLLSRDSKVTLVDSKGNKNYTLAPEYNNGQLYTSFPIPLEYSEGKIHLGMIPNEAPTEPEFYDRPLDLSINLSTNEVEENTDFKYPDFLRSGEFYGVSSWNYSRKRTYKGDIFFSFNYDPTLYKISKEGGVEKYVYSTGETDLNQDNSLNPDTELQEQLSYFLGHTQYYHLYPDRESGYIYRTVHFGGNDDEIDAGLKWWEKDWAIQIINEQMELVGVKYFDGRIYNWRGISSENGKLLIPVHNKSNLDASEDNLTFHIFKVVDIEE